MGVVPELGAVGAGEEACVLKEVVAGARESEVEHLHWLGREGGVRDGWQLA